MLQLKSKKSKFPYNYFLLLFVNVNIHNKIFEAGIAIIFHIRLRVLKGKATGTLNPTIIIFDGFKSIDGPDS